MSTEKLELTDEQVNVLEKLGYKLAGKNLDVSSLAGRVPVLRQIGTAEAMLRPEDLEYGDIKICTTRC